MKIMLFPAMLLLSAAGFSQAAVNQKMIQVNKKEYSIQAPGGWSVDSSKQMGTDLVLFSLLENSQDQFRENVNVMVQNIAGLNIDLNKYTAISENQIKTMAVDPVIVESVKVKTSKTSLQKIIYTATQGGFKLKFEQYYFVTAKKAYVITLTTEAGKFAIFKPLGEEILNSFVLK